jgi:hypothetical protein
MIYYVTKIFINITNYIGKTNEKYQKKNFL